VARALIVGCGCCGQAAAARLRERGWAVRGTSRDPARRERLAELGIEPAAADPDRVGSIVELLGDVTVVVWALGSAGGAGDRAAALHRERLPSALEKLVDTPVRGFVYEGSGSVEAGALAAGRATVEAAAERWRIPVATVAESREDPGAWAEAIATATESVIAPAAAAGPGQFPV
jgi:uncharacterized protein YbjT (DUF2867 family)